MHEYRSTAVLTTASPTLMIVAGLGVKAAKHFDHVGAATKGSRGSGILRSLVWAVGHKRSNIIGSYSWGRSSHRTLIKSTGSPKVRQWWAKHFDHINTLVIPFAGPFLTAMLMLPRWHECAGFALLGQGTRGRPGVCRRDDGRRRDKG